MQTSKSTAASALVAAMLAGGGGVVLLQPTTYPTLGHALVAQGYTHSILVVVASHPELRQLRPINVDAALGSPFTAGGDERWFARYGFHIAERAGNTIGEAWSDETLLRVMNHPSNPLSLACNPTCGVSEQEKQDSLLLTASGVGPWSVPAYTSLFVRLERELYPPAPPPPDGTPTPEPSPTPPPTPLPTGARWWTSERPCLSPQPGAVCLEVGFTPSVLSTGATSIEVN